MKLLLPIILFGMLLFAGCVYSPRANEKLPPRITPSIAPTAAPSNIPSIAPVPSTNANMANPASVHCIDNRGKLEIVDTPEGQIGICTFEDGTKCEEWSYFRGECVPGANPSVACPSECPQYAPASPDFCKHGKILPPTVDECGCLGPPRCEPVACTMDAKICPDGSAVGRVAPDCEFEPCPGVV
ncbi:MAG: DUF333 domain-containing protein [Candidatus Micrarchaeota archaeon]